MKKHGDVSVNLNIVGISQNAQSRQKRKRTNTAEKARERIQENSSAGLCAKDVIRSDVGDVCLDSTGASRSVDGVSDIVFPGQFVPISIPHMPVGVFAPHPKADLQQSSELLKRLNSSVDASRTTLTSMAPMMVSDPRHFDSRDSTLVSSALGATAVNMTQFCKPPEEKFLSIGQVSRSDSSPSKLHPLMATTTAMPSSVFNIEMLTAGGGGSGGGQAPGPDRSAEDRDRGADGEDLSTDKKPKGQSSYGLQTLAEICFNSSV